MTASSVRETEKAQGYVDALDNARCEGKWSDIPELIRKVAKHAPHRKCLIQTANAETQVIAHIDKTRPGTAKGQTTPNQISDLSELIPPLISAIEEAEGTPQDVFQAQVCLGWIHWTMSEPGLAIGRLPKDFEESTINALSGGENVVTKWTEICIIKAGYIKCAAQSIITGTEDALKTASSILPRLATPNSALASSPQALYWSERFLSKTALTASEKVQPNEPAKNAFKIEIALKAFRLWSGHPYVKRRDIAAGYATSQSAVSHESNSRPSVWMLYYRLLSIILQHGLGYFPPSDGRPHSQLANELRRVETVCENVLLRETRFPTASASNPQVEAWVEDVIHNWEVLCGPNWRDDDIGEGGQDGVSRNVLDILYRAATKTYHSHLILRRLFHVHVALAEFDLALKALDTYIEIVVNAKSRAEKAAEIGALESDEILLQTVSEGVLLLCGYGSENEARKAKDLTAILQDFIQRNVADASFANTNGDTTTSVSPRVIAMAYRAIGVGLGNWSRWTPFNESRDDIRAEAIENLEKSLTPDLDAQNNLSTRYALALLLAEARDLDNAILHVRSALSAKSTARVPPELDMTTHSHERDSVPLWHLLALLLSAKQEFDMASRSCEAAFEQFPSTLTALGNNGRRSHRRASMHMNKEALRHLRGRAKEHIIETRMTQLALIELMEGPEVAVNYSDHLLTLFTALFEDLELDVNPVKVARPRQHLEPPKSSAGTVKSFRGSIFGRKKISKVADRVNTTETIPPVPIRETLASGDSDGPAIHVTDESVAGSTSSPREEHHKLHKHHTSQGSRLNGSDKTTDDVTTIEKGYEFDSSAPPADEIGIAVSDIPAQPSDEKQSATQPLPAVPHNLDYKREPRPAGHSRQPPEQDARLPAPHRFESPTRALTKFPAVEAQKHALAVLAKVWLLIAGLYRRASLFEDAHEAWEEAFKQVEKFQALVAARESSARAFSERVWGVSKSSEELWGDVYAERGALSQARASPHEAMKYYEEAIARFPDHPKATVGLSNLLLDIWEGKIIAEPVRSPLDIDNLESSFVKPATQLDMMSPQASTNTALVYSVVKSPDGLSTSAENSGSPARKDEKIRHKSRLAARDRAYGLLSILTKTGSSWDNSEAWYALSRAYEAGSQLGKTKEVLWWCVELEDRKPIRHWWNLGSGSYVL